MWFFLPIVNTEVWFFGILKRSLCYLCFPELILTLVVLVVPLGMLCKLLDRSGKYALPVTVVLGSLVVSVPHLVIFCKSGLYEAVKAAEIRSFLTMCVLPSQCVVLLVPLLAVLAPIISVSILLLIHKTLSKLLKRPANHLELFSVVAVFDVMLVPSIRMQELTNASVAYDLWSLLWLSVVFCAWSSRAGYKLALLATTGVLALASTLEFAVTW